MKMMRAFLFIFAAFSAFSSVNPDLQSARDKQDRPSLDRMVSEYRSAADKQQNDSNAQYKLALASSYAAEVAIEQRDKAKGRELAETGMRAAEKAVALNGNSSEYHRILGTLCGQMVSSQGLAGLKYAKCALNEVNRAIELDPKSSDAYLSHGVGNYYLPPAFGGGFELAIKDFEKAIDLNPKSADAYLWLGLALRKENKNAEARKAFEKSLALNPNRVWAKQQLDKTPAQ
jgi:tetratricopeptide (TPR) repeat protein